METDYKPWDFFDKNPNNTKFQKLATCKLCGRVMNYTSTTHNLKSHVQRLHPEVGLEHINQAKAKVNQNYSHKKRNNKNRIWGFFTLTEEDDCLAKCNFCDQVRSYDGSGMSNLSKHLKRMHPEAYDRWLNSKPPNIDDSSQDMSYLDADAAGNNDADSDTHKPDEALWGFFELLDARKARCVVCHATVGSKNSDLRSHLEKKHPKLISHDSQDGNQQLEDSDASMEGDDDNTYTEVVYLEQDALQDTPSTEKNKLKRKPITSHPRLSSPDHYVTKRLKPDEDDELTAFLKYIKILLKKLSPEVFAKIQLDIVNTIMSANSKYGDNVTLQNINNSYVELQKANVITVNEVTGNSLGHNYSITVAPCTSKSDERASVSNTVSDRKQEYLNNANENGSS